MMDKPAGPSAGPGGGETGGGGERMAGRPPRDRDSARREERGGRRGPGGRRFFRRRKVCKFCVEKMDHIDYKDPNIRQFIGERGKILPRRLTGVCTPHQRQLQVAIQRARNIALLPFAVAR